MKRNDTLTLVLPGFLELVGSTSGLQKVAIKEEVRVAAAAEVIQCSPDTVKRLIDSGAIFGERLTDRPKSMYKVCGACVASWREFRRPCEAHTPQNSHAS
jgi:hypothetical protein